MGTPSLKPSDLQRKRLLARAHREDMKLIRLWIGGWLDAQKACRRAGNKAGVLANEHRKDALRILLHDMKMRGPLK